MTAKERWEEGMNGEISFWKQFRTVHPKWFRGGMDKSRPLDPVVDECLAKIAPIRASVLDVGSGMLSSLGFVSSHLPAERLQIHYVDVLGAEFVRIARKQNFTLPIIHCTACAEELYATFSSPHGQHKFDVIYCRNALDHCYDPMTALVQMASVLAPGGYVVLRHYLRCGARNNYSSLHAWNLYDKADTLWLSGREGPGQDIGYLYGKGGDCHLTRLEQYKEGPETLVLAVYRKGVAGGT